MKLCMSHYFHKSVPHAKFEAKSSSSFGDMTSQNFLQKKGTSRQFRLFTPGKRVQCLKDGFLCPESFLFTQKLTPMSISAIFKQTKNVSFSKFLRLSMRKEQQQPPCFTNFAKIWPVRVLRVKTRGHQVCAL